MIKIVDTHLHLWDVENFSIPWLAGIDALNKNHLIADYEKAAGSYLPDKMVYMEVDVAATEKLKEAEYVVDLIRQPNAKVKAGVFAAMLGSDGFDGLLASYLKIDEVRGVRHVLHVGEYARGYCLRPKFLADLRKVFDKGLLFDLCIRPSELKDAVSLVDEFPEGKFVLDHCGNPDPLIIAGKKPDSSDTKENIFAHTAEDWKEQITNLGNRENVICKISGIIARVDPDSFSPADLKPVVDHCIDSFGEDRIIFGGDWPVCNLTLGLKVWIESLKEIVKDRSPALQRKLFSENAERIYGNLA